ncbi:MAG: NAD-dependent deacylase [Desulfovibrio sp.]|jgi:NAD-dependent deacetylase|nr:NAD-dependent deacylase [Desulfovibrio sp.]
MIIVLTGAGISQESGLQTFRGAGGLWNGMRAEYLATPEAFERDPDQFHAFYNTRRRRLLDPEVAPNAAHLALARLERETDESLLLITQNVDNLHERAGSANLLHMHGELLKARCTRCNGTFNWEKDIRSGDACPGCGKSGTLRPDIVLFSERPYFMEEIDEALERCRTFVSIGTSGSVYPAAGFAGRARQCGARVLELNLESSSDAPAFHEGRYGRAGEIVPAWVAETLASK